MGGRLQAMVHAAEELRPKLGAFYPSLNDEQKVRFNPTCADWVVRPRQINGLGEKSPLHFFWEVGSGAACEARQLAFGEAHSFGQDDAETIKECGLSRIGLGDATQADLAVGCGR